MDFSRKSGSTKEKKKAGKGKERKRKTAENHNFMSYDLVMGYHCLRTGTDLVFSVVRPTMAMGCCKESSNFEEKDHGD